MVVIPADLYTNLCPRQSPTKKPRFYRADTKKESVSTFPNTPHFLNPPDLGLLWFSVERVNKLPHDPNLQGRVRKKSCWTIA